MIASTFNQNPSMVETGSSSGMAESDITAMRETLRAQQQLLQKLYAELDQEQEASATAASEALEMILRLQGEKAAVKMEGSHYKRMAEEKIEHAEATLEVFEELMNQKEMEITSLEFQVQAYKHKLLSLGYDLNAIASEFEFAEDLLLNRDESNQQNWENGQSSTVRRLNSLPPIPLKNTLRAARKRERSPSPASVTLPASDVIPKTDHEVTSPSLDLPTKSVGYEGGTLDAYWNQIERLDEKVKVISDCRESRAERSPNLRIRRGRSCSILSQRSTKLTCDQTDRVAYTNSDKVSLREGTQDREAEANPSCSISVHDVFEVPQTSERHKVREHGKNRLERWNSDAESRLTKPDSVSEEMVESHVKHDADKLKSMLSSHRDIKIPNPKDMKTIILQRNEGMGLDCNAQAEFHKLHQRIERLETERISSRQEITHEGHGAEQLQLLQDIHCQLKLIQSEMRSWKTEKAKPKNDVFLDPLQEAMLYFWI